MRRTDKLPELLSPAGDFECLVAAVAAGADAVYVGGKRFGARAYAKNFEIEELSRAVEYCHLHGVRLYVTVNTLLHDDEMLSALEYCKELYRIGVDAVIAADLGLISLLTELCPGLEIHGSTQMSVHNTVGADTAYGLGCKRVVLARELSLEDIKLTTDASKPEIEVFLHGALCVCYSGQCLFSALVGGRSGNRGECAQPCRLPYNDSYPISLKDLSLAEHIPELVKSGVASLKIEGRMKAPSYVYTVTKIYRRLLDECRNANKSEQNSLASAFSRGGFTDGYFVGNTYSNMLGIRSRDDKESTREVSQGMSFEPMRVPVRARVSIIKGQCAEMTVFDDTRSYTAYGDTVEGAVSHPLDAEGVLDRLSRTGGTFLELKPEDIELTLEDGVNMSQASLNALRRAACRGFALSERRVEDGNIILPDFNKRKKSDVSNTALFLNGAVAESLGDKLKIFSKVFVPLFSAEAKSGKYGVYVPPVITDSEWKEVEYALEKCAAAGVTSALVGNLSHIILVRKYGMEPYGDTRLNVENIYAYRALEALGVYDVTVSPELTLSMARDIGAGVTVYGRIPLMLTERCFIRGGECHGVCPEKKLKDRRGAEFPVVREWKHRNLILNSALTYMGDKLTELERYNINTRHYIFTTESVDEVRAVLSAIEQGGACPLSIPVRRVGLRAEKHAADGSKSGMRQKHTDRYRKANNKEKRKTK